MTRTLSQISINAYLQVKPKLTEREQWVLEAIEILGEASAETVAEYYGVGVNVISGRFTGLKKKRLIFPTRKMPTKSGSLSQYFSTRKEVEFGDEL